MKYILLGNQAFLPVHLRAMWFLVSLMIMRIISSIFPKYMIHISVGAFILALLLQYIGLFTQVSDYLQLQTTMLSYHYFVFGHVMKRYNSFNIQVPFPNKFMLPVYGLAFLFLLILGARCVGDVNIFRGVMGKSVVLMLVVSYGLSLLLLKFIELTCRKPVKEVMQLSDGTLFILCTHLTPIVYIECYYNYESKIFPFIITGAILIISYILIIILSKYAPILLGRYNIK